MAGRRLLRGARVWSRNIPPLETGTTWGRPRERGRSRETGALYGCLAPAGGARRRHGQATDQPVRRGRAGPLHLIHGGPCLILPGRNARAWTGAPPAGMPAAMIRGQTGCVRGIEWVRRDGRREAQGWRGVRAVAPTTRFVRDHGVLAASGVPGRPAEDPARRGAMQAPSRSPAEGCPPGNRPGGRACAQACGSLVRNAPNLCTRGGNAGDPAARPPPYKGL